MAAMKYHIFYLILISVLLLLIAFLMIPKMINSNQDYDYLQLKTDIEIIDPKSGEKLGFLKKGIVLTLPSLDDLSGIDLSDNQRYKLLVDLVGVSYEQREYRNTTSTISYSGISSKTSGP